MSKARLEIQKGDHSPSTGLGIYEAVRDAWGDGLPQGDRNSGKSVPGNHSHLAKPNPTDSPIREGRLEFSLIF
jgi:hypothetical protein